MRTGRRWGFELRLLVLAKGRWQWHDHGSNAASTAAVTAPGPSKTWPRLPASGPRSALVQWLKLSLTPRLASMMPPGAPFRNTGDRAGQARPGLLLGRSLGPRGPSEKNVRERTERRCPNEQRARECQGYHLSYGGEFRIIGADGVGYFETETESPSSTNPLKITDGMFQVTRIVCCLLELGLRFRNLSPCGHDLI